METKIRASYTKPNADPDCDSALEELVIHGLVTTLPPAPNPIRDLLDVVDDKTVVQSFVTVQLEFR